jgi:hypothetical protein
MRNKVNLLGVFIGCQGTAEKIECQVVAEGIDKKAKD